MIEGFYIPGGVKLIVSSVLPMPSYERMVSTMGKVYHIYSATKLIHAIKGQRCMYVSQWLYDQYKNAKLKEDGL